MWTWISAKIVAIGLGIAYVMNGQANVSIVGAIRSTHMHSVMNVSRHIRPRLVRLGQVFVMLATLLRWKDRDMATIRDIQTSLENKLHIKSEWVNTGGGNMSLVVVAGYELGNIDVCPSDSPIVVYVGHNECSDMDTDRDTWAVALTTIHGDEHISESMNANDILLYIASVAIGALGGVEL